MEEEVCMHEHHPCLQLLTLALQDEEAYVHSKSFEQLDVHWLVGGCSSAEEHPVEPSDV